MFSSLFTALTVVTQLPQGSQPQRSVFVVLNMGIRDLRENDYLFLFPANAADVFCTYGTYPSDISAIDCNARTTITVDSTVSPLESAVVGQGESAVEFTTFLDGIEVETDTVVAAFTSPGSSAVSAILDRDLLEVYSHASFFSSVPTIAAKTTTSVVIAVRTTNLFGEFDSVTIAVLVPCLVAVIIAFGAAVKMLKVPLESPDTAVIETRSDDVRLGTDEDAKDDRLSRLIAAHDMEQAAASSAAAISTPSSPPTKTEMNVTLPVERALTAESPSQATEAAKPEAGAAKPSKWVCSVVFSLVRKIWLVLTAD